MTLPVPGDVAPGVVPPETDSLEAILRAVMGRLSEDQRKTLYSASISKGGITVRDGGALKVQLANGVVIFYAGPLVYQTVSYQGVIMRRADGTPLFYTFPVNGDVDVIAWRFLDQFGNEIVASDALTGGLARPWIPLAGIPVLSTSLPMTASAGFVAIWSTGAIPKEQPFVDVAALLRSDTGATGNARYTMNGSPVGTGVAITAGMFGWTSTQKIALPGDFYDFVTIELEVQRTNAVGTVGGVFKGTQRQT